VIAGVVIGSANQELVAVISHRLNHPSISMNKVAVIEDAAELMGMLNTIETDLILLDVNLPKLSKGLVKQLSKGFEVIILVSEESEIPWRTSRKTNYSTISNLAKTLGRYKPVYQNDSIENPRGELILVASIAAANGSSTIAANLAFTMSEDSSVLLSDFDFIQPTLFAQLSQATENQGLASLLAKLTKIDLTPAELAQHCLELTPTLRLLAGIGNSQLISELNFSLLDEVIEVGLELDEKLILDLGILQPFGQIAKLQQDLISICHRLVLVIAADPISVLTTCNWLELQALSCKSKLHLVFNKISSNSDAVELNNLFKTSFDLSAQAFFPLDHKLFTYSLWSGKPALLVKPKSDFAKELHFWISSKNASKANTHRIDKPKRKEFGKKKSKERLSRLSEAS